MAYGEIPRCHRAVSSGRVSSDFSSINPILTFRPFRDMDQMSQLISDAVATSDSDWQYRPAVDVYVTLLSQGCTAVSNSRRHNRGIIFSSLGTLLLSIEKMVRDPDTSPDEKEELREQRDRCFQIFEDEFKELGMTFPKRLCVLLTLAKPMLSLIVFITGRYGRWSCHPF